MQASHRTTKPRCWVGTGLALASLLPLVADLGCRSRKPEGETRPAPAASSAAPSVADAPVARVKPPRADGGAPREVSKETLTAYAEALAAGRKASARKDFNGAIDHFTRALEAIPNDAIALGERGLAEMRAGLNDAARTDLEKAVSLGGPAKLRAQLYFNLGLLAEQSNDKESALGAFAKSNRLHRTAAATRKLKDGPDVCPVSVGEPSDDVVRVKSWADVVGKLRPKSTASSEAEARAVLCPKDAEVACAADDQTWFVPVWEDGESPRWHATFDAVVRVDGGFVVVRGVGRIWDNGGFKCGPSTPTFSARVDRGVLIINSSAETCYTAALRTGRPSIARKANRVRPTNLPTGTCAR